MSFYDHKCLQPLQCVLDSKLTVERDTPNCAHCGKYIIYFTHEPTIIEVAFVNKYVVGEAKEKFMIEYDEMLKKERGENRAKILISYHSGSGSTKLISKVFSEQLSGEFSVDIIGIGPGFRYSRFKSYDLVLLGFPTYYLMPSFSALEFVRNMPVMDKKILFFLFTTYGLYSGNSIRMLSNTLRKKNTTIIGYAQIRGPASDGVLLFPSVRLFSRYEKLANEKISMAVSEIKNFMQDRKEKMKVPHRRWYSPVTGLFKRQLGKIDYSQYRSNLRILEDRCSNCKICVKDCIWGCWKEGEDSPVLDISKCEFCLKCVHNCPDKAIIFSEGMKDRIRLDWKFYKELEDKTFK